MRTTVSAPDGTRITVEHPPGAAEQDIIAYAQQDYAARMSRRQQATQAEEARVRENFQREERSRPLAERVRANFGAGMHNLVQGVAGLPRLFGADTGPTEAELTESKRLKEQLAETLPDYYAGKVLQGAGEVVPTLLAPGGGALAATARGVGRALPATLAARLADTAVTSGLVSAATTPGDLSERGIAAALGAGGALVAPAATSLGIGAYRMARPSAAGREAGREAALAQRLARELGETRANELVGKLDNPQAVAEFQRAGVARPSAAQLTRDPTLQSFETGLRGQRPELFTPLDELAARGRWQKLSEIAQGPEALARAEGARDVAADPLREAALKAASRVPDFAQPVGAAVQAILTGPSRTLPAARTMANWVQKELSEGVTPDQLYSLRKALAGGIPRGSELGAAVSQARRERKVLIDAIDEALDTASGGQWSPYMQKYQELSAPVTSMKAGQGMQEAFGSAKEIPGGGREMTAYALRQALKKHGQKQFGEQTFPRITPDERQTIEAIARSIEASDAAKQAQALIGSRTAGNIAAQNRAGEAIARAATHAVASGVPGGNLAAEVALNAIGSAMKGSRQETFAGLLNDPERLRQALAMALATAKRSSVATEYGSRGLRGGAVQFTD